jgi:hypothetical protein
MPEPKLVILVHGWSVRNTDTYGQLPDRLEAEARVQGGPDIDFRHIWLARYVSFRDEVKVEDLSRAFEAALRQELGQELSAGRRLVVITHSTGGPVVRDWWHRFYLQAGRPEACPLSHLIMLAPANFGSALAQLGKGVISRLDTFFQGVEPGQGVLDWLELGSPEACALNTQWVNSEPPWRGDRPIFPFVLIGQSIDRKLYDHVNSYTGESGSDGVVRVAAANLNATYARLVQQVPQSMTEKGKARWVAPALVLVEPAKHAPQTAFAVLPGLAHSGKDKGILRSIKASGDHATVHAILRCLSVNSPADYQRICTEFATLTAQTQQQELIERQKGVFSDSYVIHDRRTMLIVRVMDDQGYVLDDFDLLLLGKGNSPDQLPPGFFIDRQRNQRHRGTLTYFLNHDAMVGTGELKDGAKLVQRVQPGMSELGFRVEPRPSDGFVHYLTGELTAHADVLDEFLRPNQTLLLDIVLRRVVRGGTFGLTRERKATDFSKTPPGEVI